MSLTIERPDYLRPYTTIQLDFRREPLGIGYDGRVLFELVVGDWKEWCSIKFSAYLHFFDLSIDLEPRWLGYFSIGFSVPLRDYRDLNFGVVFWAPGVWPIGFSPVELFWYKD